MSTWTERFIDTPRGGPRLHILEEGEGPLVVLLHGFPEIAYAWRRQLPALAAAGYHVVAPDQRGYGTSSGSNEPARCTTLHLVGDVVALLDALKAPTAVVVGHDNGATVAWHCAMLRPDRFRAVAALSTPFHPRRAAPPTQALRELVGPEGYLYMLHFQAPGVAERELEAFGLRRALVRALYACSGDAPPEARWRPVGPPGAGFFDGTHDPERLPPWLSDADVDVYMTAYERSGLTGPLNWYRAMDASWEHLAPFAGAKITPPALFLYGDQDPSVPWQFEAIHRMPKHVPNLREIVALRGAGHWIGQERPAEVNEALIRFLGSLA